MIFPLKICKLTKQEIELFYQCYAQQHLEYTFEGMWFRNQEQVNQKQSGWIDETSKRRRFIHFRHNFRILDNYLVMASSYLYMSVRLPLDEYETYVSKIKTSLAKNGYTYQKNNYQKEDLSIKITEYEHHPQEENIHNYKTVDITITNNHAEDTKQFEEQLWKLQIKGIRQKEKRGCPIYLNSLQSLKPYLPAQIELGCGPSIEAGIEPLYFLHELYKVQRHSDGTFYFGNDDDLILQILEKDQQKYEEFAHMIKNCIKAKPTKFHHNLKKLYDQGLLVGDLLNNNFDHLSSYVGIKEKLLRIYQIEEYFPKIEFDKRAKSLICIGTHADRRMVQKQAREKGLQIIYIDPEGFSTKEGFESYPIEGARETDYVLKLNALDLAQLIETELLS